MMRVKPKHVARMLEVAHLVATWGACPEGRRHACVLADAGKYIVSTGYNGLTVPCPVQGHCQYMTKEQMWKSCKANHAEHNALENLPRAPFRFLVAFVTKKPCVICEERLRAAGIIRVYWEERTGYSIIKGTKLLCTK